MSRQIDARTDRRLMEALSGREELLTFARAVVLHLSGSPATAGDQGEIAERVLRVLEWTLGSPEAEPPEDTEVLASFFQNADLLEPGAPRTHRIARGVMAAVERAKGSVG